MDIINIIEQARLCGSSHIQLQKIRSNPEVCVRKDGWLSLLLTSLALGPLPQSELLQAPELFSYVTLSKASKLPGPEFPYFKMWPAVPTSKTCWEIN